MVLNVADEVADPVRELYRRYPYPPLESVGASYAPLGDLEYVRHVFWPGRVSFGGLRVLEAGCGTGTTAVQMACAYPEVEVTALDISETSLGIARQLARERGAGPNLTFRLGRIEDMEDAGGRGYDYIVSSGVLHHLADPLVGTQRLVALLSPSGGLGVMLYATYGRHAIYVVQDLFRRMTSGEPIERQVELARRILPQLPDCNPFTSANLVDHKWSDDAGLVDLLLHPRDVSYTVPKILSLIRDSGLRLERFFGHARYRPETYLHDEATRARLAALSEDDRYVIAELLHGAMSKHTFFATRREHQPIRMPTRGIALLVQRPWRSPLMRWPDWLPPGVGPDRVRPIIAGSVTVEDLPTDVLVRRFDLDGWNLEVVSACNGLRTAAQIFDLPTVQGALPGSDRDEKLQAFGSFLEELAHHEVMLFEP